MVYLLNVNKKRHKKRHKCDKNGEICDKKVLILL